MFFATPCFQVTLQTGWNPQRIPPSGHDGRPDAVAIVAIVAACQRALPRGKKRLDLGPHEDHEAKQPAKIETIMNTNEKL